MIRMSPVQKGNDVGQSVERLRFQKGWTQEMLAVQVQLRGGHMTRGIVANIESHRSSVNERQILFLAHVLGVRAGDLFGEGFSPTQAWHERRRR